MDGKRSYSSGVGLAAGVLLALYLFLPVMFVIPVFAAGERKWISETRVDRIMKMFIPLKLLGEVFPLYSEMVAKEARLCERFGLLPSME